MRLIAAIACFLIGAALMVSAVGLAWGLVIVLAFIVAGLVFVLLAVTRWPG